MIPARLLLPAAALLLELVCAVGTWVAWQAAGHDGVVPALAVLLVTAPVGLLIATQLPERVAHRIGRGLGISALAPEAAAIWRQVRTIVMDPARSLTTGHLVVIEVKAIDPDHERNLRWFAGALAHHYDDPVGRAVAKLAGVGRTTDVAQFPGQGIRGAVDRHPVRVGAPSWIGVAELDRAHGTGATVAVEVDQRWLGHIIVADEIRADASRQLGRLRTLGLTAVLASPQEEKRVARLARLAASQAWHSETIPLGFAEALAATEGPVGLVSAEEDGSGRLTVVTRDLDGHTGQSGAITTTSPAVDHIVHAVSLAIRGHRARTRAIRTAWALTAVSLPFAALGLLSPWAALAVAVITWLAVGLTVASGFNGIRLPIAAAAAT